VTPAGLRDLVQAARQGHACPLAGGAIIPGLYVLKSPPIAWDPDPAVRVARVLRQFSLEAAEVLLTTGTLLDSRP
jgi:hypothetical protein